TRVAADPFLLGSVFPPQTEDEITRHFGTEFAQALIAAPPGQWTGPLHSSYGLHLVRLEHVTPAAPQDFERVRERAAYALLTEREKQVLRDELTRLRLNYRVELPATETSAGLIPGFAS
ncbi:MAG: peptidylprolyl isomerase, partial [Nevskiales bacterium]